MISKKQVTLRAKLELVKASKHLGVIMEYPELKEDLKRVESLSFEQTIMSLSLIEKAIEIAQIYR